MASISSITTNNPSTVLHHEDEDQVVFKSSPPATSSNLSGGGGPQKTSPSQAPAPVGTGSKRSSLGVIAPQQPPFSPSPLLLGGDVHPQQNGNSADSSSWDLSDKLMQMQLNPATATTNSSNNTGGTSKEAVFPNLNDGLNGDSGVAMNTLAPPADLTSDKQPHSRQSSNGTTSSVQDSPTVPTPGQQQKPGPQGQAGKPFTGANDAYGADPYVSYNNNNEYGGRVHPGSTHFSPINGNFASIAGQQQQQQQAATSQFGFGSFHSPPQTHDLSFAGLNGATNGMGGGGIGQTYNTAQRPNAQNPSGFAPYGSPPPNAYGAAGMMSPTLASPTFLPAGLNPYASPIIPPQGNPYTTYNSNGFEMSPGSPVLSGATQSHFAAPGGANPGRGPFTPPPTQYGRGRGQGIPAPAPGGTMRGGAVNGAGGPITPNRGTRGPRGRGGAGSQMMMSPGGAPSVYGSPYGPPLSPTPYDMGVGAAPGQNAGGATPGTPQTPQVFQPQATNPELASLMLQMAAAGYQQGMMSPYAIANGGPGVGMNPSFMSMSMGMGGMFNGMGGEGAPPDWPGMEGALPGNWPMGMSPPSSGPSANNRKLGLYKTELCRSFEEKGECRYGDKCQFAHGDSEQRKVERHPKYKTEICRTFWVSGSCPYGKRCCFIHTELPSNGAANGGGSGAAEGGNTPSNQNGNSNGNNNPNGDTRNRSMSTNSDPNDPPSSLLARISAKAQANNIARSGDGSPANNSSGNNNNGAANNGAGQPTEAVVAAAINRAMAKFGAPDPSVTNTVLRKLDAPPPPPPVEVVPAPKVPAVFSNFPVGNSSSNGGSGGLGGGHHRISASVDFGRVSRNLGSDLTAGFGGGGHARNPSASSVVPNSLLSRSPNSQLSGHSTPYGSSTTPNNGLASNGIQASSLLDRAWA